MFGKSGDGIGILQCNTTKSKNIVFHLFVF